MEFNLQSIKELFKNKPAQVVLVAITLLIALASAAYFASSGSQQNSSEDIKTVQAGLEDENKPVREEIAVDPTVSKNVEDTSRFKSRDLFQALVAQTESADVTPVTGVPDTSPTSPYDSEGKTNWPTGYPTSPSSDPVTTPVPTPASPPVSTSSWMRLESLSDKLAVVRFDRTGDGSDAKIYEVKPGEKFEEHYMIVALGNNAVVVWKGDERIEMKLGEVYYIQ